MIETIVLKILDVVITQYPIAGVAFMFLGFIFIALELFIKATPNKEDDKKLSKWKSGYLGPFILFCTNKVQSFFKNKK